MFGSDLRYGYRVLTKDRGFTATVVLTLALGIGAATTIFSVVKTVLLEPLPYRDPDRLVIIRERIRKITPELLAVPAPDVVEFQKATEAFDDVAGWVSGTRDISGDAGQPARIHVTRATANLFPLLGRAPVIGRTYSAEEDRLRQPVIVLNHALWRTRYASDPKIVGRKILLDRVPHTVIGVMEPGFRFPAQGLRGSDPADAWVPMAFTDQELKTLGDNFNYNALGRLRTGVSLEQAAAVLHAVGSRIFTQYPAEVRGDFSLEVVPVSLREQVVGNVRTLVLLLSAAVLLLLLIACGNVAGLLLSRAAAREREFAIRAAIGAARWRIARQWFAESALLSLAAGVVGLLMAWYGTDALARMTRLNIPRLDEVHVDVPVLLAALSISMLTALLFGTVPAWFGTQAELTGGLKDGGRGSSGRGRQRVRSVLVTSEIALALTLLAGAGLLLRSFLAARQSDPGFRVENVLSMRLNLPNTAYAKGTDIAAFSEELGRRLGALPGVMAVGYGNDLPLGGTNWMRLFTTDNEAAMTGKRPPIAFTVVYGDYLQALGIPLQRGRIFVPQDRDARVVIVSAATARRLWPGADPIGRHLKWGPPQSTDPWFTVIGAVGDVKEHTLDRASMLHAYAPAGQAMQGSRLWIDNQHWVIRSSAAPETLSRAVRETVAAVDPQMPVERLETMEAAVDGSLSSRRIETWVIGLFAGAALLLAAIGIYGVVAYSVSQRSQEIGIRMALGATSTAIVSLVLRQALLLTLAGVAAGAALSFGLTRFIGTLLFGVKPTDPVTFGAVALLLFAAAVMACALPARRAAGVDPLVTLRRD